MDSGIYQIENKLNNNKYIGSSLNIEKRCAGHKYRLNKNNHENSHLQNAWNLYGESNFEFSIVWFCKPEELLQEEQIFLDAIKPEYNIAKYALSPMLGRKQTSSAKEKIALALRGKIRSEEHCLHLSQVNKGKKPSLKCIENSRNKRKGKSLSKDHKDNISNSIRGHYKNFQEKRKKK